MAQQKPEKPPRKNKQLKLSITEKEKWRKILKEIDKNEAPVSVLKSITVNLVDGTKVHIDIQELLSDGVSPEDLEYDINEKLLRLDDIIKSVDFYISVDHVAKAIQPATDNLLKNL